MTLTRTYNAMQSAAGAQASFCCASFAVTLLDAIIVASIIIFGFNVSLISVPVAVLSLVLLVGVLGLKLNRAGDAK